MEVRLYQGSSLTPILVCCGDRLADVVRQETRRIVMFADEIFSENKEQVEEHLGLSLLWKRDPLPVCK